MPNPDLSRFGGSSTAEERRTRALEAAAEVLRQDYLSEYETTAPVSDFVRDATRYVEAYERALGATVRSDGTREGFKLLAEHRDECFCDDESLPFVVHERQRFDLNKNGGKNGHTMWHVFRCNDPDCPAQMAVRWDVLASFVGREP